MSIFSYACLPPLLTERLSVQLPGCLRHFTQTYGIVCKNAGILRMDADSIRRLQENIHLAEQMGAKVEVLYSDDISFQIAEFARLSGVTKVVMGRSAAIRHRLWGKTPLTERLILNAPNLDVYIIPDAVAVKDLYHVKKAAKNSVIFSAGDILKSAGLLLAASLVGFFFYNLGISEANIITIYVLSVLLTALVTKTGYTA